MADLAAAALKVIHGELGIDEDWTIWRDRAFSWVGFRLRQEFLVSPPCTPCSAADCFAH
jgi:hypothetical protein